MDLSSMVYSNSNHDTVGSEVRTAISEESQLYFEFETETQMYLVNQQVHCEYIRLPQIFSLPLMPLWLHGLMNVRGLIVPVINLATLLGSKADRMSQECKHVLILDKNENAAALVIEGPPKVVQHADENRIALAEQKNMPTGICEYKFKKNGRDFYVINHRFLFESLSQFEFNLASSEG